MADTKQVQWTPVETLPPDRREFYLVAHSTPPIVVTEAEYRKGKFYRIAGDYGVISDVSHWQPLPAPPGPAPEKEEK